MSTPQGPPPGWKPQHGVWPGYVPPVQAQPNIGQPSTSDWWYDGHKWRPPVKPMSRGQAAAQLPGALIKLIFLLLLLGLCVVFVGSLLFGK